MKNVAISFSFKAEDLNVLLEILKLNFENPPNVSVFCNASAETFELIKDVIEYDLIDNFYHVPDENCSPKNTARETKRRQPLDLFKLVLKEFSRRQESFCFLEGDCFPLSEDHFFEPFKRLVSADVIAKKFDFTKVKAEDFSDENHSEIIRQTILNAKKMPDGYVYPGGMYFSSDSSSKILSQLEQHYDEMLDGKRNFEGMLGTLFVRAGINCQKLNDVFCFTYPFTNQICPHTFLIHQHNIMNLKDIFEVCEIKNGKWVNYVQNETFFAPCAANHIKVARNEIVVELCTLVIKQ